MVDIRMPRKWSEMFPEGRFVYYEGDDPKGFRKEMVAKFNFDPKSDGCYNKRCGYRFHCPGRCIDEVYGGDYPLGS